MWVRPDLGSDVGQNAELSSNMRRDALRTLSHYAAFTAGRYHHPHDQNALQRSNGIRHPVAAGSMPLCWSLHYRRPCDIAAD